MTRKQLIVLISATLVIGIILGYYIAPHKVVTLEKVVTKEVESKKANVQTVTKIIERPGGEKITHIVTTDRTITDTRTEESHLKQAQISLPQWRVGLLGGLSFSGSTNYGGIVQHRFIGPFSLGVIGSKEGVMAVASMDF